MSSVRPFSMISYRELLISTSSVNWPGVLHTAGRGGLVPTIRTGQIVGKTQALRLAGEHWPDLAERLAEVGMARRDADRALGRRHTHAAIELAERILAVRLHI
jgi:hypothetical protein